MKFEGFDDWIEIFEGGKQIDSDGGEHDGDALIKKAVATFDPKFHEPPAVVGHPNDNSPAFAWVEGLKETGNVLLAKFKDVVPEFAQAVTDGLYKKRSASFYPDGRLRHVGFLGAAPPAVKGLADLKFNAQEDAVTFEFSETSAWTWETVAGLFRKLRDHLIEKEGKDAADKIIPDWDVEYIKDEATKTEEREDGPMMKFAEFLEAFTFWKKQGGDPDAASPAASAGTATFTEADIETAKKEGAEAERKKADTEFAEKTGKATKEARDKEIATFCEALIKDGKVPPSWAESGLLEFMQALDGETGISFAEGTDKKTPSQWFRDFLEGFGKSAIFQEMATKEKAGHSAEFAEAKKDQDLGESIAAKVNPVTSNE